MNCMKRILLLSFLLSASSVFAQTEIKSIGGYLWDIGHEPKTFSGKLQLSFVSSEQGFPSFGTVVAGGGYNNTQDGAAFQLYIPYGTSYGGNSPRIRMGLYNNLGWSDWATFFTSANANSATSDWKAKTLFVYDKIGIGTTNPTDKLAVNGAIRAKEIKVDSGPWPDYVFDLDYNLLPLSEIKQFVQTNKHLPGIPNEQLVKKEGVALGEMNRKLLEKIEELTLHLIQVNEKVDYLMEENEKLKKNIK